MQLEGQIHRYLSQLTSLTGARLGFNVFGFLAPKKFGLMHLGTLSLALGLLGCTSREIGLPYSVVPEQIVSIASGDTLVFESGRRVVLYGADAPGVDQPYGKESKTALQAMTKGVKSVFVDYRLSDSRGGDAGIVYTDDGRDLSFMMICKGHARWIEATSAHEQQYKKCQTQARKMKLGLWATLP